MERDSLGSPVVLVIEDEPDHAELVMRGLEDSGFEVVIVPDLASARTFFATRTPDIVVSDLRLPDGGALDLLDADACPAPVIVMTSYGGESAGDDAIARGALDYVVKSPTMFRELPEIIDRALRKR